MELFVDFHLRRPDSVGIRRVWPFVKPDADKLARGVCDALTGWIWKDDALVVRLIVQKRYADADTGAFIRVRRAPVGPSVPWEIEGV